MLRGHLMQKINDYFDWTLIRFTMVLIAKKLMFEYSTAVLRIKN